MISRHAVPLLLAALLASLGGRVEAQAMLPAELESKKDEILERLPGPVGDPESLFARKLSVQELADRLTRSKVDLKDLQKKIEKLRQDPKSSQEFDRTSKIPGVPDDISAALLQWAREGQKQELGDLQKLLNQKPSTLTPQPGLPGLAERMRRPMQAIVPQPSSGGNETSSAHQTPDSPADPAAPVVRGPQDQASLTRGLLNMVESVAKMDPSLSESPALRKVIRELSQHVGENDPRWQKLSGSAANLKDKWSGWAHALRLERLLPKGGVSWPKNLAPSALARLAGPRPRVPEGLSSSIPTGIPRTDSERWQPFIMIVGLVVIGGLFWWLVSRHTGKQSATDAEPWHLGPWPVAPGAVATREELIRAFEYLSLLCLGAPARSWNHEVIAARLGQEAGGANRAAPLLTWDPDARRQAAEALAGLYEKARYAPGSQPLPEAALAAARRDLCFLAGVPSA
jgi:hypothetical protein